MPELPEVETVVRAIRPDLIGRTIAGVRCGRKKLRKPWQRSWNKVLVGQTIDCVQRRGKWILLCLRNGSAVQVHLGMTGRVHVAATDDPRQGHLHVRFPLDQGDRELRFHDPRRFGSVSYLQPPEVADFLNGHQLGPEPFSLDVATLRQSLRRTERCLKAILLDQTVVAGVGNIYADEALFEAKLHPQRRGCDVKPAEAERLRAAIVTVLNRAIQHKGSTILNFFYGEGQQGSFQNEFKVYQQTGEPCPRCDRPIQHVRLAGRSTHFCPRCQQPPRLPQA